MNVTIRFDAVRVMALLMIVLCFAMFGMIAADGDWFAFCPYCLGTFGLAALSSKEEA